MKTIALLGQPNSGKSTVFNQLTGSHQHVGNWPGKTVEKKEGRFTHKGIKYQIADLPGSYGLTGNSDEEKITVDYINSGKADLVLILVDASQLERSMFMLSEFARMDAPSVLLLNMADVAASQNKTIDAGVLAEHLGIPVMLFTAAESKGYEALKDLLVKELSEPHKLKSAPEAHEDIKVSAKLKYEWIDKVLQGVVSSKQKTYKLSKFDKAATSPVLGKIISVGIILLAFLVAMFICVPFMSLGKMFPALLNQPISDLLTGWHVHPWLVSIFSTIIPNTLYFSLSMAAFVLGVNLVFGFLEEIGFLARAAYQFDGILSKLGLQGKAVAPILMGFGCTIGGTCGTRVMDNWGQKMLAMAIVWAVPCGSIWSVVPVVSDMFFPWWGTILVCLGVLAYMVVLMLIVSKLFSKKLSPAETRSGMVMELPTYHKAHWKHIIKEAVLKAWDIFIRAMKTLIVVSLLVWGLSYTSSGNITDSLLYKVGTTIEPVTRFFGMGWQTFSGFIASAFAKEAVLGVLNAIYCGQSTVMDVAFNVNKPGVDNLVLGQVMSQTVSPAEALAFIFACTFNIPCLMALSTTYKESHSLKWTAKVGAFYVCSALVLSFIVYHIAALFI